MRPVRCADEPPQFDSAVRQPGLSAIDELVGRPPRQVRPGLRRKQVATREEQIPPDQFPPYWRNALPWLTELYNGYCAFLAMYLEPATATSTVDHMIPKSRDWRHVYEWKNYRLCAHLINSRKADMAEIIDPFECKPGWFALEFVGYQVKVGPHPPPNKQLQVNETLKLLNLPPCCLLRQRYAEAYLAHDISHGYLTRRAPFLAEELRRQGWLLPNDQ